MIIIGTLVALSLYIVYVFLTSFNLYLKCNVNQRLCVPILVHCILPTRSVVPP